MSCICLIRALANLIAALCVNFTLSLCVACSFVALQFTIVSLNAVDYIFYKSTGWFSLRQSHFDVVKDS